MNSSLILISFVSTAAFSIICRLILKQNLVTLRATQMYSKSKKTRLFYITRFIPKFGIHSFMN